MAFEAKVYRILIASPSDVYEEREITTRVIQEWNDLHSFNKKIVLLPLRWETHTTPNYGERPQETINRQIVDECDIVIGFFWTRIGSPTGNDVSGTVEEIKRAATNGKPVMLYFSKRGINPSEIDTEQLDKLNLFKSELYKIALVESFNSLVEYRDKLSRQLEIKIRELQDNANKNKSIDCNLIAGDNGKKLSDDDTLSSEKILVSNEEIREMFKMKPKKSDVHVSPGTLMSHIRKIQAQSNQIPVVINIENKDNRIYSNINLELKIKCNKENAFKLDRIRGADSDTILNKIYRNNFTENQEKYLTKLYSTDIQKTTSLEWEVHASQFSLLPHKSINIDPLLLFYPEDNCIITLDIRLISDNLFDILEFKRIFNIKYSTRKLTLEEKAQFVKASIVENDEPPF